MSAFDIRKDCLYCGKPVDKTTKLPKHRRSQYSDAETKELLSSVTTKALERNDSWGKAVHVRIQNVGDLVAAEATYHHPCQSDFHTGRPAPGDKNPRGRPSGSDDMKKREAFFKLCNHIDTAETCHQYSISDLETLLKEFSIDDEVYSAKALKSKLRDHYKHNLVITSEWGRETIYTFLNHANDMLRQL